MCVYLSLYISLSLYIYICVRIYIYIYIYIYTLWGSSVKLGAMQRRLSPSGRFSSESHLRIPFGESSLSTSIKYYKLSTMFTMK